LVVSVDACLSNTIMRETIGGDHILRSTQTGRSDHPQFHNQGLRPRHPEHPFDTVPAFPRDFKGGALGYA